MGCEERIKQLEDKVADLSEKINALQSEKWVTPAELAEIMQCSVNNIYIKIRSGEIYATEKLGNIKRIPMSQFYTNTAEPLKRRKKEPKSIKEIVFGV